MSIMLEFFHTFHNQLVNVDRIPTAVVAIFITMIVGFLTGPMFGNSNSFLTIALDKIFGRIGERIDRTSRPKKDLVFRGTIFTVFLLLVALYLSYVLETRYIPYQDLTLLMLGISSGAVWYVILKLYFTIENDSKADGGYFGLSRSTRINLNSTDEFGVTRYAIYYLGHSFDKNLVAPIFWYFIADIPGMLIYSFLSFLVWRFGKSGYSKGFANTALVLEKIMGYAPHLFASLLFCFASAITPTAKTLRAFSMWWSIKDKANYTEGGAVTSALAWSLNISLGGPAADISGSTLPKKWVGPEGATAQLTHKYLKRAIFLTIVAQIIFVLALLSVYFFWSKI
ncbi:MAG: adenosylcobinamide-phosphate synthase [Alphaproteobacteria bacterium]|nr:adenosylcobinamide-phosphate synthase [Alphaproteobacteria bacterium]